MISFIRRLDRIRRQTSLDSQPDHPIAADASASAVATEAEIPSWDLRTVVNRIHSLNIDVRSYDSAIVVRQLLTSMDTRDEGEHLTVVLALDDWFSGHLPALIERQHPARRIAVTSVSGRLHGLTSAEVLFRSEGALGWSEIVVERNPWKALDEAVRAAEPGDRVVLLWPEWIDDREVRRILDA